MNILILTTHLNPGGITSYLYTLSKGLKRKGNAVSLVSSGGQRSAEFAGCGVQNIVLNIRTKSECDLRIYAPLKKLAAFIRNNDIAVIHAQTRITQVMGRLLSRMTGVPYVSTCHGFFKKRLSRRIAPCWGQSVIAISPAVKAHLQEDFGVPDERIKLVVNGIDLQDFPLANEDLKRQKKEEFQVNNYPVVGIIARLADIKGHEVLIRALPRIISRIPHIKCMVVGKGKQEEELKKLVNELSLEEHVRFLPFVNQTSSMLPLLDVFVMPSLQEGLGLSVMEAQAAGLPVVASRAGGLPSLVEHGKTGLLVEPGDSEGLASAIMELFENQQRAKEMGLAARQFIQKEFSAEKMVEETARVYKG